MFQFTDDCLIGIKEIDNEHFGLFELINQADAMRKGPEMSVARVKDVVEDLIKYAANHFAHEEAYMKEHRDPELERQKKEHAAFTEKVNNLDLKGLTDEKADEFLKEILNFLAHWLYRHILGSDMMIGKMGSLKEEDPFAFTEKYHTGIEIVDAEHQKLFELIRDTNDVIHAEFLHDKYDEIVRVLNGLKEYTIVHFADEESYMESIGYEGLANQKIAHQMFVDKLNEINLEDVDDNQDAYLEELITFLLNWLTNHILMMDKKIPA